MWNFFAHDYTIKWGDQRNISPVAQKGANYIVDTNATGEYKAAVPRKPSTQVYPAFVYPLAGEVMMNDPAATMSLIVTFL